MKTCSRCSQDRPDDAFHKQSRSRDGLAAWCKPCMREYHKENGVALRGQHNALRKSYREQALAGYGSRCACCGETERAFLVFDHVNDGGAEHRTKVSASALPWWIVRNGFPETIQVLCANCNMAKHFNPGGCPHNLPDPSTPSVHSESLARRI